MDVVDDGGDCAGPAEKPVLSPIYSADAGQGTNLSCSSFPDEFCYLCSYMDRTLPGTDEMTMRDHVELRRVPTAAQSDAHLLRELQRGLRVQ